MVSVLVISKGSGMMPFFKVEGGAVSGTAPSRNFLQLTCWRPVD